MSYTIPAEFDEIRPYEPSEMKQAFEDLLNDRQFSLMLKGFVPWLPKSIRNALFRLAFTGVKTPLDFQLRFMKPVVKWIIRKHTDGCTFDDQSLTTHDSASSRPTLRFRRTNIRRLLFRISFFSFPFLISPTIIYLSFLVRSLARSTCFLISILNRRHPRLLFKQFAEIARIVVAYLIRDRVGLVVRRREQLLRLGDADVRQIVPEVLSRFLFK